MLIDSVEIDGVKTCDFMISLLRFLLTGIFMCKRTVYSNVSLVLYESRGINAFSPSRNIFEMSMS